MKKKKKTCVYCQGPITDESLSHYNCGCRTKPSPVALGVSYVLAHDKYRDAIQEINHLSIHFSAMNEEDLRKTLGEVFEITNKTISKVIELREQY